MPGNNQITFGIGFNVNESNLNKLKQSLKEIQQLTAQDLMRNGQFNNLQQADEKLKQIKRSAAEVQDALSKAFNANLGTTNITKLNTELKKIDLNTIARNFGHAGAAGQAAFNQLSTSVFKVNTQLKQSSSFISNIRTTLANTIKWNIASSAINTFTGSIQSAFNYVKALDASLTDIRIVTGQSREEMAQFAQQANDAAQALGRQTKDYTNAALSFYQQGLNETEVQARTEATLKAQNVTGAGKEMTDYLTAVWNGYKVVNDEIELYVDKLAAVADSSASNLSELAIGMSKVASTANNMGVSMDQLTAQLATIIATTRQAPETVGNALKTIYARINDIKSGTDEAEISLGNYTEKMASLGFNVLDADGRLKNTGKTMEEIGERWSTMTREQQIYLAQTMAGQRQMNNLIALFDNWEKYSEMLNVSLNSQGSLNEKNERYMDSLAAHMNQLKAAVEGMQDALINEDDLKGLYDIGSDIIHLVTQFIEGIGGMRGAVAGFGAIATRIFGTQLTDSIITALNNARLLNNELNAQASRSAFSQKWSNIANDLTQSEAIRTQAQAYVELDAAIQRVYSSLSQEEKEAINATMEQIAATDDLRASLLETGEQAAHMAEAYRQFTDRADSQQKNLFTQTDKGELNFNNNGLKEQRVLLDLLISKVTQYRKVLTEFQNNTTIDLDSVQQRFATVALSSDQVGDAFNRLVLDTEILKDSTDENEQQFRKLVEVLFEIQAAAKKGLFQDSAGVLQALDDFALGSDEARAYLAPLIDEFINTSNAAKRYKQTLQEGEEQARSFNNQLFSTKEAVKQLHQVLNDKAFAQGITQMTQGLSSFLFGLQSLSTVKTTLKDIKEGTVDTGDAILRMSTSLIMGLSMLTTGWKGLKAGTMAAASALAAFPKFATAATSAGYVVGKGFTSAGVAAQFLSASLLGLIGPLMPYVLVIGAIGGAIALLVKHYNALSDAHKETLEQVKQLNEQYDNLKTTYDELQSSFSNYNEAKTALDEMTIGTEEWREKLEDVNDQIIELINKYPTLAKYIQNVNGELILEQEYQKEFLQQQKELVDQVHNASLLASNITRNAENQVIYQNVARSTRRVAIDGGNYSVKTDDIERVITAALKNANLQVDWDRTKDVSSNYTREDFMQQYQDEIGIAQDRVIAAILDNSVALQNATNSIEANSETNKLVSETIAHSINESSGNERYAQSEYKETIDQITGNLLEKDTARLSEITKIILDGLKGSLFGINQDKSLLQEYADLQGWTVANPKIKVGTRATQERFFDGNEYHWIDDKDIANAIALQRYMDEIQNQVGNITGDVEDFVKQAQKASLDSDTIAALLTFAGGQQGSISNLNSFQLQSLLSFLDSSGGLSAAEIGIVRDDIQESDLEHRMFKIAESMVSAVANSLTDLNHLNNNGRIFSSSYFSADQYQEIVDYITSAFVKGGEEGANIVGHLFQLLSTSVPWGQMTEADAERINQLFTLLQGLTTDTSFADFTKTLQDLGLIEADLTDENAQYVQSLFNLLIPSKDLTGAFEELTSQYASAKDIVKGLQLGDAISQENADTLKAFGINLDDFFARNLRGEYELVTSAEQLNDIVDNLTFDNLLEAIKNINAEIARLSKFNIEDILSGDLEFDNYNANLQAGSLSERDRQRAIERANYVAEAGGAGDLSAEEAKQLSVNLEKDNWIDGSDLDALNTAVTLVGDLSDRIDGLTQSTTKLSEAAAMSAQNIDQLETLFHNGTISGEQFGKALSNAAKAEAEANDLDFEALDAYANYLLDTQVALNGNRKEAYELAIAHTRLNKGVKTLASNWDDWMEALEGGDPEEYGRALNELREATADLLNITDDALSSDFFTGENLKDLELAADGDAEAIERLRAAAATDIFLQAFAVDNFDDLDQKWQDTLNRLINYASENDLTAYAQLDDTNFINALNEMVQASNMTAEQVGNALQAIGYDAEVETEKTTHPSVMQVPETTYDIQTTRVPGFGIIPTHIIPHTSIKDVDYEQIVETPVIRALTYTGSAGGNIAKGNVGGRSNGGKKGGGGGGGGSKPKTYTPLKPMKAKIDPYHDVNIKIGDTQEAIDKLQKERDKLIGKEAVKNLTKQIELMEQEKDLLKEKAGIAQGELQRQAQELANLGAIFNANGDIANYKDLLLNKQNQVNKAIEICNGLTGDEREAYEKYVKDLEQEYKDLEEAIKEFDETNQLLDDLGLDYQDIINKQIELAIEAFDLEINVKLDVEDAQREFNEFRKKIIDQVKDDQYGALATASARNYSQYYNIDENGNRGGIVLDLQRHAEAVQREAAKIQNGEWSSIYGNDLAAAADDLKKYNDELMKALEEAQDVIDETHQHFLDAIDAMDEAFDTQQENLDKLDDLLAHDMEILQLVHGEENFEEMNNLLEQQNQQDIKRLNALQKEQEYWQEKIDQYEEGTEEWEKAMANWQDAFEKTQDAMVQAIENVQKKWENSINSVMSKLRNQAYGGNMQSALEEWDKTTWHADRYLDSLERANGLLNLQNKYINAINNTNDPKIQEKLAQLEEHQLNSLSQKTHLREIDLKIAEQQLTVLQAQIALEEAQESKTKLRLRRDSQGNYNYQYVADEENIQDKILTYANELENYRQMVKDNLREDLDAINEYTQEYFDKMAEAQMMFGDDSERLAERMEELADQYIGPDGYITLLANDSAEDQQELQKATVTTAIGLYDILQNKGAGLYGVLTTGAQGLLKGLGEGSQALADSINEGSISLIDALKTNYGDIDSLTDDFYDTIGAKSLAFLTGGDGSILELVDSLLNSNGGKIPDLLDLFKTDSFDPVIESLSQTSQDALFGPEGVFPEWGTAIADIADKYEEEFLPTVSQAIEDLKKVHDEYKGKLDEIQEAAGRTFGDIALGLYFDTGYTNALNTATDALIKTQAAEVEAAEKVYDALKKNVDVFKESSAAAIQAANSLFLFWLALNGQTASGLPYSVEGFDPNIGVTQPTITSLPPPEPSYNPESGGGGDIGSGSGSTGTTSANKQIDRGGTHGIARNATGIPTSITNSVGYGNWVNVGGKVVKLASGGYTGDWADDDGRLALLHKKEIVLNPEDTKNMLDTVQIVRGITDQVGAMTNAAATNFGGNSIMNALSSAGEQILQNVVINADFPAVQDAEQIKQAFNELVNLASQRASANRRVQ